MTNVNRSIVSMKSNKTRRNWAEDAEFQAKKRKGESRKQARKAAHEADYLREEA